MSPQTPRQNLREAYRSRLTSLRPRRYETMDGLPPFILDRTGTRVLFRYEKGGEIMILTPVHTTRGDTIYKNDQGIVVLRLHRVGSATYFPRPESKGVVAWATGATTRLRPPSLTLQQLEKTLGQLADDLAQRAEHDLSISVTGASEDTAWIFLDAVHNLYISLQRINRVARRLEPLADVEFIRVIAGDQPSAILTDKELVLTVTPRRKFSGRLSSMQLQNSLLQNLFDAELAELMVSEPTAEPDSQLETKVKP